MKKPFIPIEVKNLGRYAFAYSLFLIGFTLCFSQANALTYEHFSNGFFSSIHVLIVDPTEHDIVPVKAKGERVSRETVPSLVRRYGALAGINGGFWQPNGSPAGILKIGGYWHSTPTKPRGAIGWSVGKEKILIDRVLTNVRLHQAKDRRQIEVLPQSVPLHTRSEQWRSMENIVGGAPLLVIGGTVVTNHDSEETSQALLVRRHPRTAVGVRDNGDWVFVVVEGRFLGFLGGMTIDELALLMKKLGCVNALNLDGGGSSTMVYQGEVVNTPSEVDQEGRAKVEEVSDAILIFPAGHLYRS